MNISYAGSQSVKKKFQTNAYFMDDVLKTKSIKYSNVQTQLLFPHYPMKISHYAPVTIAGQLCKDCIFRGTLVTLIVMECVEKPHGSSDSLHGTMRLLCNSCNQFSIEAARLGDGTKSNTLT